MAAIEDAVYALTDGGAQVLSPADPRVVDQFGDFLYVASDRVRAVKLVQSRHLAAIAASDFVWLVAPGGYVGQSGAMEIGYAVANKTPIFASEVPIDLTLRQYVTTLPSPSDALRRVQAGNEPAAALPGPANVLLDPSGTISLAHRELDSLELALSTSRTRDSGQGESVADLLLAGIVTPLRSS
jgi:hypothetical protein